jgi:peroxiredoxin Q/BCP
VVSKHSRTALVGILAGLFGIAAASELAVGNAAPGFALNDQHGKEHRLVDYRGNWVVVYFYPKDDTPGCTTEACAFRDDIAALRTMGVTVLGISLDDEKSHKRFADKHGLPFPLLADTRGETAKAYGALWGFGPLRFAKRQTFVIDPAGNIAKIYRNVDPEGHSDRVIGDLQALGARRANGPS